MHDNHRRSARLLDPESCPDPELPFDEAECDECGDRIGMIYSEWEDRFGRETGGERWIETWQMPNGRYVCGDCVE